MYLSKNKKSPFYQIVYKNKLGKITSKTTMKKTKTEAALFLVEFKKKLTEPEQLKPNRIKLEDFQTEYINLVSSRLTKKYIRNVSDSLKRLQSFTGNIYLDLIDHRQAELFISDVFRTAKYAAAAHYRTLKSAFSKAEEWNYISSNPFKKFKLPKLPKSFPLFITYDELLKINDKVATPILRDMFLTGFFSGLRLGELLNLNWSMINFDQKIITLMNSETFTTKSKRERIIPINQALMDILKRLHAKRTKFDFENRVFLKRNRFPFNDNYISRTFKKAVGAAGFNKRFHFHTLRHSFASNLVQSGVSLYVVKELLGHKDITTTQIYAHLQTDNLFDAVKNLEPENLKAKNSRDDAKVKNNPLKYEYSLN